LLNLEISVGYIQQRSQWGSYSPYWPEEKKKKALLAHLRGLFAAIGVSNDF